MSVYGKGADVQWVWGDGMQNGRILARYDESGDYVIDGKSRSIDASKSNPVYLIERPDGTQVLRNHEQIEAAAGIRS